MKSTSIRSRNILKDLKKPNNGMMKTLIISTIATLCVICSCQSPEKTNASHIRFGIYETVRSIEIPDPVIEKIKTAGIVFEN